ncbi:MAG: alpha/beta fold hydrolase [Bacteroidota bacterium]
MRNALINRDNGRDLLFDYFPSNLKSAPIIVFCHGFKGYKDWGNWNEMGLYFQRKGFHFLKFNFSLNGGTIENPIDFPDLEAFAQNTYSQELNDLNDVINYVNGELSELNGCSFEKLFLIGHSRGGAIATLKTAEDDRVDKLVTMAAPANLEVRFENYNLEEWQSIGRVYIKNGRTKQMMPLNFAFYKDFLNNRERLDIPSRATSISIPTFILHANDDPVVSLENAEHLNSWIKDSRIYISAEGGHTFNMQHPSSEMPQTFLKILDVIQEFLDF